MKQAEISVGNRLFCKIGADLCPVIVVSVVVGNKESRWKDERRTRFQVRRADESAPLPKLRSAAALRP